MKKGETDQPRHFWGRAGAGVLVKARDTGRFLVMHRSPDVNEPGTYGIIGGRIDGEEEPREAALRELREETEYKGRVSLKPIYKFRAKDSDFTYQNFLGTVDREFEPDLNWESSGYKWAGIDEIKQMKNLHFGLRELVSIAGGKLGGEKGRKISGRRKR